MIVEQKVHEFDILKPSNTKTCVCSPLFVGDQESAVANLPRLESFEGSSLLRDASRPRDTESRERDAPSHDPPDATPTTVKPDLRYKRVTVKASLLLWLGIHFWIPACWGVCEEVRGSIQENYWLFFQGVISNFRSHALNDEWYRWFVSSLVLHKTSGYSRHEASLLDFRSQCFSPKFPIPRFSTRFWMITWGWLSWHCGLQISFLPWILWQASSPQYLGGAFSSYIYICIYTYRSSVLVIFSSVVYQQNYAWLTCWVFCLYIIECLRLMVHSFFSMLLLSKAGMTRQVPETVSFHLTLLVATPRW